MTPGELGDWVARGGITFAPPRIPKHGTYSEYTNHNCRCESCLQANRTYHREWYRRNRDTVLARRAELEAIDAKWQAL